MSESQAWDAYDRWLRQSGNWMNTRDIDTRYVHKSGVNGTLWNHVTTDHARVMITRQDKPADQTRFHIISG